MADEIDYDKLARAIKRGNSGSSSNSDKRLDTSGLENNLKGAGDSAIKFGSIMKEGATDVFESWQKLSSSGSNFSGDLIGMTKAAYNSRMEFGQWSDLIKENGAQLSSLGGNVTRGTEAFARLSKEFFDSGAANELRNIGYTSKDLNEILAIQAASQKSGYKDTEEGRRKSYKAAADLAEQMDAIAKLTGKSREAQMEEMKKKQVDGQVEAKLRLLANGDMQKYAELQSSYQKLALEARKRGDEELFKQQFATGTYMTKAAGTQAAVLGQQSRAVEEAAARLAKGDLAGAREASSKADAAALKNAGDRTLLTLATAGEAGGAAATAAQKSVEATDTMYHNIQRVADANGILLKTQQDYADALKLAYQDIKQTQIGGRQDIDPKTGRPTGPYKDVGQSGRFASAAQSASQDIKSAGATIGAEMVTPQRLKELDDLASKYYAVGLAKGLEDAARKGMNNQNSTPTTGPDGKPRPGGPVSSEQADEERGGAVGQAASIVKGLTNLTVDAVTGVANIFLDGKKIPGRSTGSIGTMGKMIEDFGQGTLTMLHGKEGVVTEAQLMNLAQGMKDVGVAGAVNTLKSSMPANQNIDISKISKDITTSISTVSGGGSTTTRSVQNDDSKAAEKELQSVKEQYAAERQSLLEKTKAQLGPDASRSDVRKAMRDSDGAKALEAKYAELMSPLEKKIEAGITWEVEKKSNAVEETKKVVEKEISIKQTARNLSQEIDAKTAKEEAEAMKKAGAEILKQADLARSIVGTSIKGMSDDAIQALLPAGASMDDFYEDMQGNLQSWSNDSAKKIEAITAAQTESLTSTFQEIEQTKTEQSAQPKVQIPNLPSIDQTKTEQSAQPKVQIPSLPSIDLNALNLPGIGPSIKAKAANVTTPKPDAATTQPDNKKPPEAGQPANAAAKPGSTTGKDASLNDVVASLNTLNKQMGQLLAQHEELGNKQVRATKNVGSGNLYKA